MKSDADQSILFALGQRIRELRRIREISQEELADIAGVHRTYIGMVERGEKNVTILTLARLAKAFGLSVSDVIKELEVGK